MRSQPTAKEIFVSRAVVFTEYGDPEVLHLIDREVGDPGAAQVRVRVRASGVNPMDYKIRGGVMPGMKPVSRPTPVGRDLAGVIEAVGADVTGLSVGDRVAGNVSGGTSAEQVLVRATDLVPLPEKLDFTTGASLGVAGTTAVRVLGLAKVQAGSTVLIHGATGGVGVFTTQLAVASGARVVGTTSEPNLEYLRSLGATAISYGDGWEDRAREQAPDGYDAVLDLTGHGVIDGSLRVIKPGGPIITIADFAASGPGVITSTGDEKGFEDALTQVVTAVSDGTVVVPIQATFPLAEATAAHRLSETGHVRGKIVLTLD